MSETHCERHGVRWFDVSPEAGKPDHRCIMCTVEHVDQLKQRNTDLCAMVARIRKESNFLKKIVEGIFSIVGGAKIGQVYIVREGDALSCIARDMLGDPYRSKRQGEWTRSRGARDRGGAKRIPAPSSHCAPFSAGRSRQFNQP